MLDPHVQANGAARGQLEGTKTEVQEGDSDDMLSNRSVTQDGEDECRAECSTDAASMVKEKSEPRDPAFLCW